MTDHTTKLFAVAVLAGGGWFVSVLWTYPAVAALLAAALVVPALLAALPYALVRGGLAVDRYARGRRHVCVPGTGVCVRVGRRSTAR